MMRGGGATPPATTQRESELEEQPRFVIGGQLKRIRHQIDLLELQFAQATAAFAETDEWDWDGSVSAIDWIRFNCKLGAGAAADRVAVGQELFSLNNSALAVEEGEIGFQHLALLVRTKQAVQEHGFTWQPEHEGELLEQARQTSVGRFWHVLRHFRHAAEPEQTVHDQADAYERRFLQLRSGLDGMLVLDGRLDPVGGAALRVALEPLTRKSGAHDERSMEQRAADALVELASHALDRGRHRPHLTVTASLGTLYRMPGFPGGELDGAPPLGADTLDRLACDCSASRLVLTAESIVVDAGRSRRIPSPAQHRALDARDRGCRWPGCGRRASWTEAHHLRHWLHGGATDLDNLILLCHRHHYLVHEGRWKLSLGPDGSLEVIRPPVEFLGWPRDRWPGNLVA